MSAQQEPPSSPAPSPPPPGAGESPKNALLRLGLELGPLIVFFVINHRATDAGQSPGQAILTSTPWFMGAMLISLVISWITERRIPLMPLITAVALGVFGGLALYYDNETFMMLKPTILNVLFGVILLVGMTREKYFLKAIFEAAFNIVDEGWRILTVRWALFFFFLAALNELVWRNFPESWVAFKVWGLMPLTMIFGMCQLPVIQRHEVESPEAPDGATKDG